jgi:hypothetical protein
MLPRIFEFMFVYGRGGTVTIEVAILAETLAQALERVGGAIPTEEAIYPGRTSSVKYLHLSANNAANKESVDWVYGPFVTEQNPGDGIYDSPELFEEAPGCQEFTLDEYLKQFEGDELEIGAGNSKC